jgi:hypothetical protein
MFSKQAGKQVKTAAKRARARQEAQLRPGSGATEAGRADARSARLIKKAKPAEPAADEAIAAAPVDIPEPPPVEAPPVVEAPAPVAEAPEPVAETGTG